MLGFVGRAFRIWFSIILWITLIGFIIGGGILGYAITYSAGIAFLGVILGALVGLIFIILTGGFVANFLNLVDNVEKIAKKHE
ncbi:MAG: hypothetical protein LBU88_04670 [Treponema sp.]|jgi:hypothetical protein|nr:hypothetical protein [Treponema sp.]